MNNSGNIIFTILLVATVPIFFSFGSQVYAEDSRNTEIIIMPETAVPGCEIDNECYVPYEVTTYVGDSITWTNTDDTGHTATSGNPTDGVDGRFNSGGIAPGASWSYLFSEMREYDYYCIMHPWMTGIVMVQEEISEKQEEVPSWIKNNAKWWSENQIDDQTFVNGIGFLIKEKIIVIAELPEQVTHTAEQKVPDWVKNNAAWWAEDKISEGEFLNAMTYLVKTGLIVVNTEMILSSDAFENNGMIPSEYTCDGDDVSPMLMISDTPQGTASLALIMDDPDAPMGTFVHWVAWNIPSDTETIGKGEALENEGVSSFGSTGYGGPCPPSGTHRYFFKLYALDIVLELSSDAKKTDLETAMSGHILKETELIGRYSRN